MSQDHAVEVLLRPAVEFYTVAVCLVGAALCLAAPWSLALTPRFGITSALGFLTLAFVRGRQGWTILRYPQKTKRYLTQRNSTPSCSGCFLKKNHQKP